MVIGNKPITIFIFIRRGIMLSPFSKEIGNVVCKLDTIPSKQDLLISSIGNEALTKRIAKIISYYKGRIGSYCNDYLLMKDNDFIPCKVFESDYLVIYVLYYNEEFYDKEQYTQSLCADIANNETVLATTDTFVEKVNGKVNIKDKNVLLISGEYSRALFNKLKNDRYYNLLEYLVTIMNDIFSDTSDSVRYYGDGLLINSVAYGNQRDYYKHAIIYHLYCKYCTNDILLQALYNSMKKTGFYESYDDFVQQNEELKEKLN